MLSGAELLSLVATCAPTVAPSTMAAIVEVESGGDPLAIHLNGDRGMKIRATSKSDALAQARDLIAAGRSVDLGLAQINSGNFARLGLSVDHAFDGCINLRAAARVLTENYERARRNQTDPQAALLTALSLYNTGHARRGVANGYVDRIVRAGLTTSASLASESTTQTEAPRPKPARWDVFGDLRTADLTPSSNIEVQP